MELPRGRSGKIRDWKAVLNLSATLSGIGLALLCTFPSCASVIYSETTDKVSIEDQADLLTDDEETDLLSQAEEIYDQTGFEIRLVTTDDADGMTTQEFAENYFESMTEDRPKTASGEACVIDMDNRQYYVATYGKLKPYINDDRRDTLLDHAEEYISDGDYAGTFASMLDDTLTYCRRGIVDGTIEYNEDTGETTVYDRSKSITPAKVGGAAAAAALAFWGVLLGVAGSYSMKFQTGDGFQVRENVRLNLTRQTDQLVNHFVTSRKLPRNDGGPSGGSSGGPTTTTHRTSGGYSAGGGGRSF